MIEGYRTDGSFGYRGERGYGGDASYVSHAHGWSAGPTSVLTECVVGLSVTGLEGREWRLEPGWGDLGWARAGFRTGLGRFEAGWVRGDNGTVVEWEVPGGTEGVVVVRDLGVVDVGGVRVEVDGVEVGDGVEVVGDGSVRVEVVATGGRYRLVVF